MQKDKIVITKKDAAEEHRRLISVLQNGTKKEVEAEIKKQRSEMKKYGIKV